MDRKVQAIEERMGAHPHPENLDTVYCGAGDDEDDDDLILATYDGRTDKFTPTLGFDDVDALVAKRQARHRRLRSARQHLRGPGRQRAAQEDGAASCARLARRHNVAVILILHTKKYADGMAGNMDAARNAGTLVGRVRVGLTLFPMTEDEAAAPRHRARPPPPLRAPRRRQAKLRRQGRHQLVRDQSRPSCAIDEDRAVTRRHLRAMGADAALPRHLQPDHPRHPARYRWRRDRPRRHSRPAPSTSPARMPPTGPATSSSGTSPTAQPARAKRILAAWETGAPPRRHRIVRGHQSQDAARPEIRSDQMAGHHLLSARDMRQSVHRGPFRSAQKSAQGHSAPIHYWPLKKEMAQTLALPAPIRLPRASFRFGANGAREAHPSTSSPRLQKNSAAARANRDDRSTAGIGPAHHRGE